MRKCILALLLFISISRSWSQETTAKMIFSDSLTSCNDIQYAVMQMIPMYYQNMLTDTAGMLLDYWEKHCGRDETIYRTRVLWAIDSGTFTDTLISDETIGYLDTYQVLAGDSTGESVWPLYYYYTPEYPLITWYKSFTDSITARAAQYSDLSEAEHFFLDFYMHPYDSMYRKIGVMPLSGTKLNRIYTQPVDGPLPNTLFHASVTGGMWLPDDKLGKIGNHPYLGGNLGFRKNKALANLGVNFRLGSSGNDYSVVYKDSLYETSEFLGIGIDLEAGRNLIQWRRHELAIFGGAGLEMIKTLTLQNDPDNADDDDYKFLFSPSILAGSSYRYYLKKDRYIGISGRYHVMNFKNKGGTNLRGNAFTFSIEYGLGSNSWLRSRKTYLSERVPAIH